MAKFRKKPVVIEAFRWPTQGQELWPTWFTAAVRSRDAIPNASHDRCEIRTLEGSMWAESGDMIIRGVKGELYPCKPDIFAATYEAVE